MVFKCAVVNCRNTSKEAILHSFPKDPELFNMWVEAIQRKDITMSRRVTSKVCDLHFSDKMKFATNRNRTNIRANAFPDLRLPGITYDEPVLSSNDTFLEELVTEEYNVQPGTSLSIGGAKFGESAVEEIDVEPTPSTSNFHFVEDLHTSGSMIQTPKCLPPGSLFESPKKGSSISIYSPRTPKQRRDLRRRFNLLHHANSTRAAQLTPKAKTFYGIARGMVRLARRLDVENSNIKKRLHEVQKFAESGDFMTTKVNQITLNFIHSQIAMQSKRSRGRRYSLEDKIFALSLLKQSPRGYRLLQKTFALPSRKVLMDLLNKVPFRTGLNRHILEAMKLSVQKMDEADRVCSVMYDEMHLDASLTYNEKTDSIDGFVDCGGGRMEKFADHAMVFMARGLRRKWKQPICYYFSESGMSAPDIVRNLKEVIRSLQEIGLKVVATVCDQLSINSTAIKMLKDETNRKYHLSGKENRCLGFEVDGSEVVPLYDCPHLLKGMRNNFSEYDVTFMWKEGTQTASWEHVQSLYELDVGDFDTRMLNKLTDAHIYKEKMKKMKVKHAAQVFSHRVSSTMRGLVKYGNECLPQNALGTANFLMFMDKLFDSVNGSLMKPEHGKMLKCA
ncbi:unnamed protein product, partial [Brassicogethes aeneus]